MTKVSLQLRDRAGGLSTAASVTINWQQPTTLLPLVGSSIQNNGDVAPLEATCGRHLGLHRTYWSLNQTGANNVNQAIAQARADRAAGRVPCLSFKLPDGMTWAQAVAGAADAAIKALNDALKGLGAWVAIHHEPEGDGVLSDWTKMQQRLLPLLTNCVPWIILTGGDTFSVPADSLANLYPVGTGANIGLDGYNRYGDADHPTSGWSEMGAKFYDKVAPEAKARGVGWAIAETGYTDAAAVKDPAWLTRAFDDMANHPVLPGWGLSYFNSSVNSNGTWPLNAVKTPVFAGILNRSR